MVIKETELHAPKIRSGRERPGAVANERRCGTIKKLETFFFPPWKR